MRGRNLKSLLSLATAICLLLAIVALPSLTPWAKATVPERNGRIVFARIQPVTFGIGNWGIDGDIYTINPNGTGIRRLTYGGTVAFPVWSPDGRRIAYSLGGSKGYAIWVMNADGSGARTLTHPGKGVEDLRPAWSPDGGRIAFDRRGQRSGHDDIWIVKSDGTNARRLHMDASDVTWSPDGKRIAFEAVSMEANTGIWVLNIRTHGLRHIVAGPLYGGDQDPTWSPDGKWIAFTGARPHRKWGIWLFNFDRGGVRRLVAGQEAISPAWSPDSSQVAFSRNYKICMIGLNGTGARQLTWLAHAADWAPDWQALHG